MEARQRTWPFVLPDARQSLQAQSAARQGNTSLLGLFYGNSRTKFPKPAEERFVLNFVIETSGEPGTLNSSGGASASFIFTGASSPMVPLSSDSCKVSNRNNSGKYSGKNPSTSR